MSEDQRELRGEPAHLRQSLLLAVLWRRAWETCGRHRVARLRRVHRLRATQKRRFRPRTTDGHHLCPIAPNPLAAQAETPRPLDEVWQTDLACTATNKDRLCVVDVLDARSREIVGWAAADAAPTGLVAAPLSVLFGWCSPRLDGSTVRIAAASNASDAYRELLRSHGVVASMSRVGNCYNHAKMESL